MCAKKSIASWRWKSASSWGDQPAFKNTATTAGPTLTWQGSPSCCATLKDMLSCHETPEVATCAEAGTYTSMAQGLHSEGEVMLPPKQVDNLLFAEDRCKCDLEWCCVPHNACFIHDSCFCKGSGSFPSVKPPHLSWSQFSHEWLVELASNLSRCPHILPPLPASEAPLPFVIPYYHH